MNNSHLTRYYARLSALTDGRNTRVPVLLSDLTRLLDLSRLPDAVLDEIAADAEKQLKEKPEK